MDEKQESCRSISGDVMIRRMKNRERQRRYRARKRLREAESNENLRNADQSCVAPQLEPELSSHNEDFANRVYCGRDWKKDARSSHLMKRARDGPADFSITLREDMTCQKISEACDDKSTGFMKGEKQKIRPVRRDWKAEARNKKD